MEKHKYQLSLNHVAYAASSSQILASSSSKTSDVILFSSPTFSKICRAVVCTIPCTYCKDVSMRFLFGISTRPIHAHWMTTLLNPEPHCVTKSISDEAQRKFTPKK